jgi:hypothetical protein
MIREADRHIQIRAERAAGRLVLCRALNVGIFGLRVDRDRSVADVLAMPIHSAETARLVLAAPAAANVALGRNRSFAGLAARDDLRAFRGELANVGHTFENALEVAMRLLQPHVHAVRKVAHWLAAGRHPPGFVGIAESALSPLVFILKDIQPRRLADEDLDIELLQVVQLREDPDTLGWQMPATNDRFVTLLSAYLVRGIPLPVQLVWADRALANA